MRLILDLHSHSGYSGGVGVIDIYQLSNSMKIKGIDVYGTGDVLHPKWFSYLKDVLIENEGVFRLKGDKNNSFFILQTEIILSYPYLKNRRKSFHVLILFPSIKVVELTVSLLEKFNVKNTIGRPFVVCNTKNDMIEFLFSLKSIDDYIEIIPAHVMTPEGVFGSKTPVYFLEEVFGEFKRYIYSVETGLSADPLMLDLIPELNKVSFISNSDSHSVSLLRVGREFTCVDVPIISYKNIIDAIRKNNIVFTGEFNPMEGRYFLTGHRGDRIKHNGESIYFTSIDRPSKCSICGKEFNMGVMERVIDIALKQERREFEYNPKRAYINIIPLIEVISTSLNKRVESKDVLSIYNSLVKDLGNEINFYIEKELSIKVLHNIDIKDEVKKSLFDVLEGRFTYDPPGFDGLYGKLVIGRNNLKDFMEFFIDRYKDS